MNNYNLKKKEFNKIDIQHSENTIINIKNNNVISSDSEIMGFNSNDICYKEYINKSSTHSKCWNCNYSTSNTNTNISIPLKYRSGIFYIYGNYCSYNCAARYVLDTYNDKNMWDIYSLLGLYYNICNKTIGEKISPAPSKLLLKDFGGTMDMDEYRNILSTHNIYNLYQPPIIPIKHRSNLLENKTTSENKHNFKLYRTKPINTSNSIYNTMNLTIDKKLSGAVDGVEGSVEGPVEGPVEDPVECADDDVEDDVEDEIEGAVEDDVEDDAEDDMVE